jgi:uncharacterized protein (DUF433 family)
MSGSILYRLSFQTKVLPMQNPYTDRPIDREALAGDLVRPGDPRHGIIWINPERMSGAPCFFGTRVPVKTLFEYLEGGSTLDDFLAGFPGVTRDHAIAVLELARHRLVARDKAA